MIKKSVSFGAYHSFTTCHYSLLTKVSEIWFYQEWVGHGQRCWLIVLYTFLRDRTCCLQTICRKQRAFHWLCYVNTFFVCVILYKDQKKKGSLQATPKAWLWKSVDCTSLKTAKYLLKWMWPIWCCKGKCFYTSFPHFTVVLNLACFLWSCMNALLFLWVIWKSAFLLNGPMN